MNRLPIKGDVFRLGAKDLMVIDAQPISEGDWRAGATYYAVDTVAYNPTTVAIGKEVEVVSGNKVVRYYFNVVGLVVTPKNQPDLSQLQLIGTVKFKTTVDTTHTITKFTEA